MATESERPERLKVSGGWKVAPSSDSKRGRRGGGGEGGEDVVEGPRWGATKCGELRRNRQRCHGCEQPRGRVGERGRCRRDGGKAKQDKRARDRDAEEQDKRQKQEKQTSQAGVGDEHDATVVERVGGGGGEG